MVGRPAGSPAAGRWPQAVKQGRRGPAPHGRMRPASCRRSRSAMQILNTLTVLALVVASFVLIVAVPVLYASNEDSGRSNRLILVGGLVWVALVLVNWGMSLFVV